MDIIPEFLSASIHFNLLVFNNTIMAAMQICGVSELLVVTFEIFTTALLKTPLFKIFYQSHLPRILNLLVIYLFAGYSPEMPVTPII